MILPSQPPLEIMRAYKAGMGEFVASGGAMWTLMLQRHTAHPVHYLDAGKTVEADPETTKLTTLAPNAGWRFLAAESGLAGACHVGSAAGVSAKMAGFSSVPVIQTVVDFLSQLPHLAAVQTDSFALRALRVPWLKFEAFWLEGSVGKEDFVIPYGGFPEVAGLQMYTVSSAKEFLTAVQPFAILVLGETMQEKAKRLRARADWYHSGKTQALADADRLEAKALVLIDINKAESKHLRTALEISGPDATALAKHIGTLKSFDELLTKVEKDKDKTLHLKIKDKKHLIGFGHQRASVPSRWRPAR